MHALYQSLGDGIASSEVHLSEVFISSNPRAVSGLQVVLPAGIVIVSRKGVRAREWKGKSITPEIRYRKLHPWR